MAQKTVYIETYGCSNNQAESQIMAGLLKEKGYSITKDEKTADIVVVNTCSVKNKTENKIINRLESLKDRKLIVAGCLPEANLKKVKRFSPNSSIVSTNHIQKIAEAADLLMENNLVEFIGKNKEEKINLPKISSNSVVDIIPISSGCTSACTFCSTKLAKGNLFSYKTEHIVEEVRNSKIGGGAKEFWLTSQDCGCYGFEAGTNSAELIKRITTDVSGAYFLRYGMANPQHVKRILPQLIESYRNEHVFKFLHVPVQSGSNEILGKMQRGHSVEDYYSVVAAFRGAFPEITIWTDVIVGFPGETEEDFLQSMELIKKTRPDIANISAYSPRPGTKASKMKKLETNIVKERTSRISLLANQIYLENNKKWLGWTGPVLIDEYKEKKQNFIGRNFAYKPVVVKENNAELGQVVEVRVIEVNSKCLIGEIV